MKSPRRIYDARRGMIALAVSFMFAAGGFRGSYELMMESVAYPRGSGPEAFFAITSILAFLLGLVAVIAVIYLLYD